MKGLKLRSYMTFMIVVDIGGERVPIIGFYSGIFGTATTRTSWTTLRPVRNANSELQGEKKRPCTLQLLMV